MILVRTVVRPSPIAGQGLFILDPVRRGQVVAIYTHDQTILTETEYVARIKAGDELVLRTGCRWIGDMFIYNAQGVEDEDYVNHSSNPNLLYHCGVLFARRDMQPEEELTVDYRYVLAQEEPGFPDSATGLEVSGASGREAMRDSARELLELLT